MDIYLMCDSIYFSDTHLHNLSQFYQQLRQFNERLEIKNIKHMIVCFLFIFPWIRINYNWSIIWKPREGWRREAVATQLPDSGPAP